ncbi:MAG TPA: DUF4097 family beta strand repeat-containing protein [Terriglobales bacterium]|nr:DUF4097 family beta strand repeat-containing protein [Terriglobales bacterium]
MWSGKFGVVVACTVALISGVSWAQAKRELHYSVTSGAMVSIVNDYGPISVKPSAGNSVLINTNARSNKVEIDGNQNGNRIEVRTHYLQRVGPEEGQVDYEVQVPSNANLTVQSALGGITAEKLMGDITLEGDSSNVQVRDFTNAHLHVRTVNGPVFLTNVRNSHVDINSASGDVTLSSVTGPKVYVNTTKGQIKYTGDLAGGGDYAFTNHSGDIDVAIPASASVDVNARSVFGSVEDAFQFRPNSHMTFVPSQGKSFAGVSNSGGASLKLHSFTGKIKVHKQ